MRHASRLLCLNRNENNRSKGRRSGTPSPHYSVYTHNDTKIQYTMPRRTNLKRIPNSYDAWIIQRWKNPFNLLCRCDLSRVTGIFKKGCVTTSRNNSGCNSERNNKWFTGLRFIFNESHQTHRAKTRRKRRRTGQWRTAKKTHNNWPKLDSRKSSANFKKRDPRRREVYAGRAHKIN